MYSTRAFPYIPSTPYSKCHLLFAQQSWKKHHSKVKRKVSRGRYVARASKRMTFELLTSRIFAEIVTSVTVRNEQYGFKSDCSLKITLSRNPARCFYKYNKILVSSRARWGSRFKLDMHNVRLRDIRDSVNVEVQEVSLCLCYINNNNERLRRSSFWIYSFWAGHSHS